MGVKLMTGATGEQNIQAVDDRECLAGVTGLDSYVFPTAGKLAATLTDSNTLTIGTGAGSLQGARFRCPTTTAVTIKSGTQAQYRRDIVGLRFSRASTGKESLSFEVLTGTPASTEAGAEDPAYDEGDLLAGDAEAFMPLYRVKLSGINVGEPEAMFSVLAPLSDIAAAVSDPVGGNIASASHTGFYCAAYETIAGVALGFNVNPAQDLAKGDRICALTTGKAFSDRGSRLLRGVFTNKQAGMYATYADDGHTITLTAEQSVSFAIGDTGNAFIPCAWVL